MLCATLGLQTGKQAQEGLYFRFFKTLDHFESLHCICYGCFLFSVLPLWPKAGRILAALPGIEPALNLPGLRWKVKS